MNNAMACDCIFNQHYHVLHCPFSGASVEVSVIDISQRQRAVHIRMSSSCRRRPTVVVAIVSDFVLTLLHYGESTFGVLNIECLG